MLLIYKTFSKLWHKSQGNILPLYIFHLFLHKKLFLLQIIECTKYIALNIIIPSYASHNFHNERKR